MKKYILFAVAFLFMFQGAVLTASAQKKKKEDVIVLAQFKGGQEALIDYLLQNTRYPREAMEQERIEIDNAEMMHALESRPKITTESIELEDVQENI